MFFLNISLSLSSISTIKILGNGKILVTGHFNKIGGFYQNNISILNEDGTLDQSFKADTNGYISSAAIQSDGKIIIGGGFTTVKGLEKKYLARLNPDGSIDEKFFIQPDGNIQAIFIQPDERF